MTPERTAELTYRMIRLEERAKDPERAREDPALGMPPAIAIARDYQDMLAEIDRLREALGKITFHQYLGGMVGIHPTILTEKPHLPGCPGCIAADALGKVSE